MCEYMLPEFKGENIQTVDCGDGTVMTVVPNTDAAAYLEYLEILRQCGFHMFAQPSKIKENLFATYIKDGIYVHAYFTAYNSTARIICGSAEMLPSQKGSTEPSKKCDPLMTLVGQPSYMNCGQGHVFLLPDGRLIVYDGGDLYADRPDYMYEELRRVAPDPEHMVVAAWFMSHPHDDHQHGFEEFIEKHADDATVKIESVVYNYGPSDIYQFVRNDGIEENGFAEAENMRKKVAKYLPHVRTVKAHTGQVLRYGDVSVEVLFTVEDYLPKTLDFVNSASLVIRLYIGDRTILMLADTTHSSGRMLENMYGEYLASDMVQIAHHGMWASHSSLYRLIAAPILIWPNNSEWADKWREDKAVATALSYAKEVYLANTCGATVKI